MTFQKKKDLKKTNVIIVQQMCELLKLVSYFKLFQTLVK